MTRIKVGKDALGGSDVFRPKPKQIRPPSNEHVDVDDKELTAEKRKSFLTDEEREQQIKKFMNDDNVHVNEHTRSKPKRNEL